MGVNITSSSRADLEFEECPYCHSESAVKFEYITAATGAWDVVKYSCLNCSRQYIQNIRERIRRPILIRASSDDGAYEYTEESTLWRTRLNYKVTDNKKEQDSAINT